MKKKTITYLFAVLALTFGAGSVVRAEEEGLAVGLMLTTGDAIYKQTDSEISALPLVSFRKGRVFIDGLSAGVSLINRKEFQLALQASYVANGYEASDSAFLQGMKERESSIDAGLDSSLLTTIGIFKFDLSTDVSGTHKGHQVSFSYGFPALETANFLVLPTAGFTWQSEELVDYYYGVRPGEARAGRAAYAPGGTVNQFVGVDISYQPWQNLELLAQIQLEQLGKEIRNSPLIDQEYRASAMFGVQYRFW